MTKPPSDVTPTAAATAAATTDTRDDDSAVGGDLAGARDVALCTPADASDSAPEVVSIRSEDTDPAEPDAESDADRATARAFKLASDGHIGGLDHVAYLLSYRTYSKEVMDYVRTAMKDLGAFNDEFQQTLLSISIPERFALLDRGNVMLGELLRRLLPSEKH